MCKWGTDTIVRVKMAPHLSYTGKERWKDCGIDSCIANLIKALQEGGIDMLTSCCGHGKTDGYIELADGRSLIINKKHDTNMPRCDDCGLLYEEFGLDTTLSVNQWNEITSDIAEEKSGLLCANCIVKRASKLSGAIAVRAVVEIAVEND